MFSHIIQKQARKKREKAKQKMRGSNTFTTDGTYFNDFSR